MNFITTRVIDIVRRELETTRAPRAYPDLTDTTTFEGDLLCSTVDLVCISMAVEEEFSVTLPVEVEDCETIGALAEMVERHRAKVDWS